MTVDYALLAEWLGEPWDYGEDSFIYWWQGRQLVRSNADIVMAVMEKLQRDKKFPCLSTIADHWILSTSRDQYSGPTPIAAVEALVRAMKEPA